jgi:hypothetical protein
LGHPCDRNRAETPVGATLAVARGRIRPCRVRNARLTVFAHSNSAWMFFVRTADFQMIFMMNHDLEHPYFAWMFFGFNL